MKITRMICMLTASVALLTVACKAKEAAPNPEETKVNQAASEKAPKGEINRDAPSASLTPKPAPAMERRGPGEKLVKEISGFTITGAPRYFGPDNLYDLIDGGAEVYTALGLKEMVTADYTSKDKPKVTVTVEIYDMQLPANASRRFAKFLEGRKDPSSLGKGLPGDIAARGLMGGANASFWKDKYLVNLTLLDETDGATMETMSALGALLLPVFAKSINDAI